MQVTLTLGDNLRYRGEFIDGKIHGAGTVTFNKIGWFGLNAKTLVGEWIDGQLIRGSYFDDKNEVATCEKLDEKYRILQGGNTLYEGT
jgi:hypothetical protein